jgi:quercetin 2,3-dioxygenase
MNTRHIERIINPPPHHWVGNGFKVHNFLPGAIGSNNRMSPFFLLDYNAKIYYQPADEKRGVGVHPHRGLETVTISYHGKIAHHDSAGNGGIISDGDVQWMTAGKAILHKEYHEESFVRSGGDFQMVQLWVNLPAKHKMTTPAYQEIPENMMGKHYLDNNQGVVKVISGSYGKVNGPAKSFTPVNLFNTFLQSEACIDFHFPEHHNTGILIVEGSVLVNQKDTVIADRFVLFKNAGDIISLKAKETSVILVMSGEPIHEPVYPYGPFLMNTKEEIAQAFEDFRNGVFGYLED